MDKDGDIDLLFANNEDNNTLYLNDGAGNFVLAAELPSWRSRGLIIYDFNGDGYPDILFANHGYRNRILFNRGFGSSISSRLFSRSATSDGFSYDELEFGLADELTHKVALADLDGDGIASDVILVNNASDSLPSSLQVVQVSANESTRLIVEKQGGNVNDLSVGDYDGDGADDIAVLHPGGALEVMSNSLTTIEVMDTNGADSIVLVDVDGSGTADVISANSREGESRLDFVGDVVNTEDDDAGAASAVTLPEASVSPLVKPVGVSAPSSGGKKSGAFGWLGLLLCAFLLKRRNMR
jgi:hypothetical protein